MLKQKLLTLWYKKLTPYKAILIALFLLFGVFGCSTSYLYNAQTKSYTSLIYVDNIPEESGMFIVAQLRTYFSNQNISTTKYILKVQLQVSENLQLNDLSGFATQGELWINASWQLVDTASKKVYVSSSSYHPAYYNVMPSSYATNNNKELAIHLALKNLSQEIILKIVALLKESHGDFNNFNTPIINNNNTAPISPDED